MGAIASQITSRTIVYSTDYSDADKKNPSKLRVTGLCVGKSPGTGEFPAQMASNVENVSIRWRHHGHSSILDVSDLQVYIGIFCSGVVIKGVYVDKTQNI